MEAVGEIASVLVVLVVLVVAVAVVVAESSTTWRRLVR